MQGEGSNMHTQEGKEAANLPWQRQRPGASRRSRWGLCCSVESVKKDFTRSGFLVRHLLSVAFRAVVLSFSSRMEAGSRQWHSSLCPALEICAFPGTHSCLRQLPAQSCPDFKGRAPATPAQERWDSLSCQDFCQQHYPVGWLDLWRGSAFLDLYYF